MAQRFLAAALAYALTALLTPTAMRLAARIGAVDVPQDARRMHKRPTPRTGGLAIFAAFVVAGGWIGGTATGFAHLLAGATLLSVLGILDDVFRLSAMTKLVVQLMAAAVAVSGRAGSVDISLWGRVWTLGWLSFPLSVLWLVVCVNAHNMIDGLDGLSASIGAVEAFVLSVVHAGQGDGALSGVALALCGCCLGYLPYNRHPARVFMGDTGSQLLGFVLGYLALSFDQRVGGELGALVPLLILAVPLSDLVFAVLRRVARGQSPFAADRGHWHHRLSDAGLTQRQTCFWMMLLAMLLGAVALLILREALYPYAVYAVFWTLAAVWGLRLAVREAHARGRENNVCSKMQVLRK